MLESIQYFHYDTERGEIIFGINKNNDKAIIFVRKINDNNWRFPYTQSKNYCSVSIQHAREFYCYFARYNSVL